MMKTPAMTSSSSSVRVRIAIAVTTPPIAIDPVSPRTPSPLGAFHQESDQSTRECGRDGGEVQGFLAHVDKHPASSVPYAMVDR